jgi:hypothetical protein
MEFKIKGDKQDGYNLFLLLFIGYSITYGTVSHPFTWRYLGGGGDGVRQWFVNLSLEPTKIYNFLMGIMYYKYVKLP